MIARGGEVELLTLSDRLRPPGIGFGVGWIHVYPSTLYADTLREAERVAVHAVHALGLRDGIAFPQVIAADGQRLGRRGGGADSRRPDGRPGAARGRRRPRRSRRCGRRSARPVPDELARPRFQQPLAIRFLTAEPGPLPTGKVLGWSGLDRVRAFPGVVQADVYLTEGEEIRPVRLDGDRRGYVIAVADTNVEALERAEAAARLLDVEVEPA